MALDLDLTGKVALITGAGRGIGRAVAEALAAVGAAVGIQDIDLDAARGAAESISRAGGKAIVLGGDVADPSLASVLVSQTLQQLGGIQILVNNASIQIFKPLLEVTCEDAHRQYQANAITPLRLVQEVLPIFRRQKFGRIINIGSVQQRRGGPDSITYSMTKAALHNMTRTLSRGLAPDQITINTIGPGIINTMRNQGYLPNAQVAAERGKRDVPIGRVGEPMDCAGLAVLLCSKAGEYITGQAIYVDGGLSA